MCSHILADGTPCWDMVYVSLDTAAPTPHLHRVRAHINRAPDHFFKWMVSRALAWHACVHTHQMDWTLGPFCQNTPLVLFSSPPFNLCLNGLSLLVVLKSALMLRMSFLGVSVCIRFLISQSNSISMSELIFCLGRNIKEHTKKSSHHLQQIEKKRI